MVGQNSLSEHCSIIAQLLDRGYGVRGAAALLTHAFTSAIGAASCQLAAACPAPTAPPTWPVHQRHRDVVHAAGADQLEQAAARWRPADAGL